MKRGIKLKVVPMLISLGLFLIGLGLIDLGIELENQKVSSIENEAILYFSDKSGNFLYLSDVDYVKDQSYVGYDEIRYDEVNGGGKITVKVENNAIAFEKGIWAHATSQVTYDISQYDYKYFTAFIGLNTTSNKGNGVIFSIFTSIDGKDWGEPVIQMPKLPGENATFVKVDIHDVNYLRLVAFDNDGNGQDHSVYADAKLVNEIADESVFLTVEEYDRIIQTQYNKQGIIDKDLEFTILKRDFVKSVGKDTLNLVYNANDENKAAIDWLMNNYDAMHYYIFGGRPDGGYYNSLFQLGRLYYNYKDDFNITTPLNNIYEPGLTEGELYKKMVITLSLTHSQNVGLWMQPSAQENKSDAVRRYAIYRYMYKNDMFKATDKVDITPWFESLKIEEMRLVLNNIIDDEEIIWLNRYVQSRIDASPNSAWGLLTPHSYISYVFPNYSNPVFYSEDNFDYFNELFAVPDMNNPGEKIGLFDVSYTIPGGKDVPEYTLKITRGTSNYKLYKVWMNFRNKFGTGAVCGGISKSGSNIRTTHGIPAAVIGQPGHAAIIYYTKNAAGQGYWGLDNDVSGWVYSEKGERFLLGWGNDRTYVKGYNIPYIVQAQEALNDYENFVKAEKLVKLANSYSEDKEMQEQLYRKAAEVQPINLDVWLGLIHLYQDDSNKTEEDWYQLAEQMFDSIKYFPFAVNNISDLLVPHFTSNAYQFKFTLLQTRIYTEAKNYQGSDVLQPALTRTLASAILGKIDTTLASFSFDGEDAEKIVLSSRFDGNGIRWDYSLDGKKTWNEVNFLGDEEHKLNLTPEEIASITSENDIYVHIVGVNYAEENLFKIDIKESLGIPSVLYANDNENKLIAAPKTLKWKLNENAQWTYYSEEEPDLTGNKTVIVQAGATGVYLSDTNTRTYTFTENIRNDKRKYIPVEHITLHSVSSEATGQGRYAQNALDANMNTSWHSDWNGRDQDKFIIIKLDEVKYLSALEFLPVSGGNGKIESAEISVSMDGEKWRVVVPETNWTYKNTNDVSLKSVDFDPARALYVKIVGKKTQAASASSSYIAATMFNFYEDVTAKFVADFSFDGDDAGKIVLYDEYQGKSFQYSLDNGKTWKNSTSDVHSLTKSELEAITEENKIKLLIEGDETEYYINIKKGEIPDTTSYLNDLENRLIGLKDTNKLEWSIEGDDKWISFSTKEPIVSGNHVLLVRKKAIGIYTASDSVRFAFTEDNQPRNRRYIPIKHLSVHSYLSQSLDKNRPFYAPNAIDGNPTTLWHTNFAVDVRQSAVKPFYTIKLDTPRYISALEFLQVKYKVNNPDSIKNVRVYVSEDAIEWKEAGRLENIPDGNTELKTIDFIKSIYGQYVKIEMDTYSMFTSLAMVNLYEDLDKNLPGEAIEYSITTKTNKDVVATIVSRDEITVINNGGSSSYIFTENGTFTFEYRDKNNELKTYVAVVDWIDKEPPKGTIHYSVKDITNGEVIATLETNEKVTITNNDGKNIYVFTENKDFEFTYVDEAGNEGSTTASVSWINPDAPIAEIEYSTKELTNKDVVVTLTNSSEEITITNNGGSNTYTFTENGSFTFEFLNSVGIKGCATATVSNIDKVAPTAVVKYNIMELTSQNVIAILDDASEEITIINNGGKNTYTFTENGVFTFEFIDRAGNMNSVKAEVNWIIDEIIEEPWNPGIIEHPTESSVSLSYDKSYSSSNTSDIDNKKEDNGNKENDNKLDEEKEHYNNQEHNKEAKSSRGFLTIVKYIILSFILIVVGYLLVIFIKKYKKNH